MRRAIVGVAGTGVLVASMFTGAGAESTLVTLSDRNTIVQVNTTSQAGLFNWFVDGMDHASKLWFWFRIGNNPEASIDALALFTEFVSDTDGDGANDTLSVTYGSLQTLTIEVTWTLRGGPDGSGTADLGLLITIDNHSGVPFDFHFFQYSDFDIGGTAGGDAEVLANANTLVVSGEGTRSETVDTPAGGHYELAPFPDTVTSLNDGSATTLGDGPTTIGPGNVTWALQWDKRIPQRGVFMISKDMSITPRRTSSS